MKRYQGTGVSGGAAVGEVYVKSAGAVVPTETAGREAERERERFLEAREQVAQELLRLCDKMKSEMGEKESAIFAAQASIARDRTLERETLRAIRQQGAGAEWAVYCASMALAQKLAATGDPLIRARADDIRDVSGRIIRTLMGIASAELAIPPGSVIVADELLPSDTAALPRDKLLGFVTSKGGFTSHVAIMARALDIPAVVGVTGIETLARNGERIALDGDSGEIVLVPDEAALTEYTLRIQKHLEQKRSVESYSRRETVTADGQRRHVEANIGGMADLDAALENGCEGVGLLRTEFLFMENTRLPSEEEQYDFYLEAARKLGDRPFIIRTLDIGGDKAMPGLHIEKEENPFLGLRAVRHSLRHRDIFIPQLRAILRAGVAGNVRVMLPMVTTLDELLLAKALIDETADALKAEGIPFAKVPVGIMVEIPAAAVMADVFAKHCDFFSIGTNDLIQYVTAADRGNSSVSHLNSMCEPAVLRLVKHVIDSAHANNISVGMCGEAAAYLPLAPLFVAMGLDAFSVNPAQVPAVRAAICGARASGRENAVGEMLGCRSATELEKALKTGIEAVLV